MTPTPESPAMGATTVSLRDVERELRRQLQELQGAGEIPVQRVRMSNLLIFCHQRETADSVAAQIADIVVVHPARVLLLVGEQGPDSEGIAASVRVRVHHLDSHHQACSEQVTLYAAGGTVNRLPFAVRSLVIGDLPINLWWASNQPPPFAGPLLFELAEGAQQIIYDSLGWVEPARGVAATALWLEQVERREVGGRWRVASDLNWRRLKFWRRVVAQALDPASAPGAAESVTEVLVEHGPHAVIQAWELVSWLAQKGDWHVHAGRVHPGMEITWRCQAPHGAIRLRIKRLEQGPPEIRRVRLACTLEGKPGALNLVVENEQRIAIVLEGVDAVPRTMTLPPRTPAEIVGRQLSDRERDPVFHDSMAVARVLAQSLLI